ncbi:MAG: hypothetical protein OEY48_02890 [Gammaproteobacteria bacterium]|nr:hypothetical protein [Gammaproteobacteria bacterium]MDH5591774.1 hypothetical protein [Gammaproteobacteria bacterium]
MDNIIISKQEQRIVDAAIKLGNWFLSLPEVGDKEAGIIKAVQASLTMLPAVEDGVLSLYGFSIEKGNSTHGLVRGWDVSLENSSETPGLLEIFSSYILIPEPIEQQAIAEKESHEVYMHWNAGEQGQNVAVDAATKWIEEVSKPLQYFDNGDILRLEMVHKNNYAELQLQHPIC